MSSSENKPPQSSVKVGNLQVSGARQIMGFVILIGFTLTILALNITIVELYRAYDGENKKSLLPYIIVNFTAWGAILFSIITLLFVDNSKWYISFSVLSLMLVVTVVILSEVYIPKQTITDERITKIIKNENYIFVALVGIVIGMSAEKPVKIKSSNN